MSDNDTLPKDKQHETMPAVQTFIPLNTLRPDSGDHTLTTTTLPDSELAEIQAANDAVLPSAKSSGGLGILSDFWDSPGRNWVLGGVAAIALTVILVAALSHHSSDTATMPSTPTPEQAAVALQHVNQQLAAGDKVLKQMGTSSEIIAQSHNEIEITNGSQIVLAEKRSAVNLTPHAVRVVGAQGPTQYQPLSKINAARYVGTLSARPSTSDLTENSAVIHGVTSSNQ